MNKEIQNYWQKRVAEIKAAETFFDKNKRALFKSAVEVTHGRAHNIFIFWISPDGKVVGAPEGHIFPTNSTTGPEEYEATGYLRGRSANLPSGRQVILIYKEVDEILGKKRKIRQLEKGIRKFPIPVSDDAIIVTNGDVLGTVGDLYSGVLG